jgi:hypothetical protein
MEKENGSEEQSWMQVRKEEDWGVERGARVYQGYYIV